MVFEYKCVAGPTIVAVRNAKVRDQAVKAFEDIMNLQAADGWEYVGIDEFHVSEPEGFLSRKRVYVPSKILVFRREKAGSPVMAAIKAQNTKAEPSMVESMQPATSTGPSAQQEEASADSPTLKAIAEKVKSSKN